MFSGSDVIGLPGWSYSPGRAVFRTPRPRRGEEPEPEIVLPWCPEVLAYVATKDSRGKITEARYTVRAGGHVDTIYAEELADGSAWRRFPAAVGAVSRQIKEALASIVQDLARAAEQRQAAPYWTPDGELALPPWDLLPKGYFARHSANPRAADTLRQYAGLNPKLALILGLSWGAGYVRPLGREAFWVHIVGGSSEGKSTSLKAAASAWGNPEIGEVIRPWNVTGVGLGAFLGDLGVLPAFLDELGTSGFSAERIKQLVLSTCQGNERMRGDRGGRRRESAPWKGVLFSTGNEAIVPRVESEAVAARVVEIISPVVADAETSDAVQALCDDLYGTWEPVALDVMGAAVKRAEEALPLPPGGAMRRLARHLCLGLGAAEVYGGLEVYRAALAAAREVLETATTELAERGAKPGDRLIEAVRQAVTGRAGSFPSREGYEAALMSDKPWRDVDGWYEDGIAMILTGRLASIAAACGIADYNPGLRELAVDGRLMVPASSRKAGQYRSQRSVAKRTTDVYIFRLDSEPSAPSAAAGCTPPEPRTEAPADHLFTPSRDLPRGTSETSETSDCAGETPSAEAAPPVAEPVTPPPPPVAKAPEALGDGQAPEAEGPRRPRRTADDENNRAAFLKAARIKFPAAREEFVTAAMNALSKALTSQATPDGMPFRRTAGYTARQLWERITGWYGEIPDLDAVRDLEIPSLGAGTSADMRLMNYFNWANRDAAEGLAVDQGQWMIGYDVNGQFLSVGGSVSLGTGRPVRRGQGGQAITLGKALRGAGYGQLAEDHQIMPGCAARAGTWLAFPMLAYLVQRGDAVPLADSIAWGEKDQRRWLNAWYNVMRNARTALMARAKRSDGHAAKMALAVLKEMYAAFLGGQLRSAKYNDTRLFRPDWNDMVVSLSAANMLRALGKATPAPIGAMRDTAWWIIPGSAKVHGIEKSEQLGKWKFSSRAPVSDDMITALRASDPTRLRNALKAAADEYLREGYSR